MKLPEIVAVGFYNSNIAAKNIHTSKKRRLSMFEIELPFDNGGVSYIDDATMPINKNMVICAKPEQVRCTKFPYKCYYLYLDFGEGALYDTLMKTPSFISTEKADVYKNIFTRMIKHYNSFDENKEIILQSLVLDLIYNINRDTVGYAKYYNYKSNDEVIIKILSYIKNNLTEDLSLEKVAKTASLSPIHFHNKFKMSVGMTLREYVENQRIKKAMNLLVTTDKLLTDIALDCGFSSQSYFSYVFKRKTNLTPRQYVLKSHKEYEI